MIDRLLQVQPSRPDVRQAQRRMQLERILDWLSAVGITASRVGYRFEWRLSPMPVRWQVDDRGVPFRLSDFLYSHSWVPLGQLYGVPPPTDRPLAHADYVHPPYSVDLEYVRYYARTVRAWAYFHASQTRLARRREQYARRRSLGLPSTAGECVVLCALQEQWELREVPARCLRWVDTRNPPVEPVQLGRREALPENLHPCGVWGDLQDSPTERGEMGPASEWPLPGIESLGTPADHKILFPVLRSPAEREASAVPPRIQPAPAAPRVRPTAEERGKRVRTEPAAAARQPGAARAPEPAEPATATAEAAEGLIHESSLARALAGKL